MKKPNPKLKKEKLGIATTLRASAARTKLPLRLVKQAQDNGCKAFQINGRVDCDMLLDFVATMEIDNSAPDFQLEKALKARVDRKLKELELERERGSLIDASKVREGWLEVIVKFKSQCYQMETAVASQAGMRLNLTADQVAAIREVHIKHNRLAIAELHNGIYCRADCPSCGKLLTEIKTEQKD